MMPGRLAAALLVGATTLVGLAFAPGTTLMGPHRVIDGDTIVVAGTTVRLNGIDAEELSEPHGHAARAALQAVVGVGGPVRCQLNGDRTRGREVGVCFNALSQDIGAELVKRGLALDCAAFSGGRYRRLEPAGARTRLTQKPYC
jgi:micrococcal nuclease